MQNSDQIKQAPPFDNEAARASRELAGAFATIAEWKDFLPSEVYNPIAQALADWIITGEQFLQNPAMLRAGLPGILREVFAQEDDEEFGDISIN